MKHIFTFNTINSVLEKIGDLKMIQLSLKKVQKVEDTIFASIIKNGEVFDIGYCHCDTTCLNFNKQENVVLDVLDSQVELESVGIIYSMTLDNKIAHISMEVDLMAA